ncbi:hypothetical protein HK14_15300 [Acetobacter cibinongensis]|uniref:SGNH hydrolase-type esterase domain-containing protein n=1 Tax=Acetobacter cibinongensis TaxID=146475 RepID=A0A1Z5YRB6_9PROT|nr:hypothetical protein HK14_15300 [Acetobacter cibinongensis]
MSNYDAASILETSDVSLNTEHGMRVVTLEGNDSLTVHAPFDGISAQKITGLSGLSKRQFSGGVVGDSPKGGGNSCAMQMSNLLLLNTAASDANLKQAYKNAATLYDYKPQTRTRIDCFGSSTTQGYLNKDGLCWPQMLHDYLWTPTEVRSISVAGSTASDFLQHTIENMLKDTKTQLRRKIAITWYGNNDINRGHPITLIVENNAKIHRQLRAAGYERLFILGQYNRNLNVSLQQAVVDGTIDADAFIDPWSIPPMMTHSDKELYHDGTHPTAIGDQIIANIIAQTLKNYL